VVREHVGSDYDRVQSIVSRLIDRDDVEIVITAGATGVEPADITIEAVDPLLEKKLATFSELFTVLAYEQIGTKAVAARTLAGIAEGRRSSVSRQPDAARLALAEIILPEATGIVELAREPEPESEGEADTEEDPDTENEAGTGEESETADETVDTGVPNEATDGGPDVGSGDRDGGGTGSDAIDKATVRERIWDDLEESGEARFPFPPHGRIPNFAGASDAADRLAEQPEWKEATTIKANPDAPQLPVRRRALHEGKTVYMAVPRPGRAVFPETRSRRTRGLRRGDDRLRFVETRRAGRPRSDRPRRSDRLGERRSDRGGWPNRQGEGYSDLEYAVLRELGLVDESTPVATTVHERQVIDDAVAIEAHDVAMDLVVTPERVVRPESGSEQPAGIDWDLLTNERLEEIPVLKRLESS